MDTDWVLIPNTHGEVSPSDMLALLTHPLIVDAVRRGEIVVHENGMFHTSDGSPLCWETLNHNDNIIGSGSTSTRA